MKIKLLFITSLIFITSCTKNQRARTFGGTENVSLNINESLLNITWKQDNMWILTLDTVTKIKYFRENSSFGILEGQIIIK